MWQLTTFLHTDQGVSYTAIGNQISFAYAARACPTVVLINSWPIKGRFQRKKYRNIMKYLLASTPQEPVFCMWTVTALIVFTNNDLWFPM